MKNIKNTPQINSIGDKSVSFIASNISIDGKLTANVGSVDLLGIIQGECLVNAMTIREEGKVIGNISGETIRVKGRVEGNINAKFVRISSTAKVVGDIFYEIISIEDGGEISGSCKRIKSTNNDIDNSKATKKDV